MRDRERRNDSDRLADRTSRTPWPTTNRLTSSPRAPSAIRTPISCVR
jgi:hypothetical protein